MRSTSIGAAVHRSPVSSTTTTSRCAGHARSTCRAAHTASAPPSTTACGSMSTTSWSSTSGGPARQLRLPHPTWSCPAAPTCGSTTLTPRTWHKYRWSTSGAAGRSRHPLQSSTAGRASTITIPRWEASRRSCATTSTSTSTGASIRRRRVPSTATTSRCAGRARLTSSPATTGSRSRWTTVHGCGLTTR